MRIVLLSKRSHQIFVQNIPEMMQKNNRPFASISFQVQGVLWLIPLRSFIKHKYAFLYPHMNKEDKGKGMKKGLDFTKAVAVDQSVTYTPINIPQAEFKFYQKNINVVKKKFVGHLKKVRKAMDKPDVPAHQNLLRYTTLKSFRTAIDQTLRPS